MLEPHIASNNGPGYDKELPDPDGEEDNPVAPLDGVVQSQREQQGEDQQAREDDELATIQQANTESDIQSTLDISKLWGLLFTSSNYPKCKFICTSGYLDL